MWKFQSKPIIHTLAKKNILCLADFFRLNFEFSRNFENTYKEIDNSEKESI